MEKDKTEYNSTVQKNFLIIKDLDVKKKVK